MTISHVVLFRRCNKQYVRITINTKDVVVIALKSDIRGTVYNHIVRQFVNFSTFAMNS